MKSILAMALMCTGCATPYAPMGFSGGYEETRISGGYVVHVSVNAFTSQGDAIAYAYRRAGELCRGGFEVENSATDSTSSYIVNKYSVQQYNKPEVTIVIRCAERAVQTVEPVTARWWCTVETEPERISYCEREREWCAKFMSGMIIKNNAFGSCHPQPVAFCVQRLTESGAAGDTCAETADDCQHWHGYLTAQGQALGECRRVE